MHAQAKAAVEQEKANKASADADVIQTQVTTDRHDDFLDGSHVSRSVGHPPTTLTGEMEQWVADQLARPVVGDVATSIGLDHFGADLSRRGQKVFEVGPQPERVDGVMLQKQEMVLGGGRELAMDSLLDD